MKDRKAGDRDCCSTPQMYTTARAKLSQEPNHTDKDGVLEPSRAASQAVLVGSWNREQSQNRQSYVFYEHDGVCAPGICGIVASGMPLNTLC